MSHRAILGVFPPLPPQPGGLTPPDPSNGLTVGGIDRSTSVGGKKISKPWMTANRFCIGREDLAPTMFPII